MTVDTLTWDALTEGDELPVLTKTPTPMQLFMFSAATWNRHLIHYSSEFARSDGLKNVAVHRALLGGFLAQMITDWLGLDGRLVSLEWSVRGSAEIDTPLTCHGKIASRFADGDKRFARCEVEVRNHRGERIVPGVAVVEFLR